MIGGKLLSNGGFGCVYHPQINCNGTIDDNTKNSKYASKIQKSNSSSDNEMNVSRKIKKIVNYRLNFAPIESNCNIQLHKLKNGKIENCELFDKYKQGEFTIMKMNFISGGDFSEYIKNITIDVKSCTDNKLRLKKSRLLIITLLDSYKYILNSLQKLINNNIVHYDLKGNNVLFDLDMNRPIIVDFGLSIDFDSISNKKMDSIFYTYSPRYYLWSPEIHLLSYINNINSDLSKKDIIKITNELKEKNYIFYDIFGNDFIDKYYDLVYKHLSKYIGQSKKTIEKELIQYYYTWDNFSLSMMFFKFFNFIFERKFVKNNFLTVFTKILLQNIHPDPKLRFTVDKTFSKLQNGLNKQNKKHDFNKLLKSVK